MLIPLLTDYEKDHIAERQALPERYLGLSDEEMDRRIAAAKADARAAGSSSSGITISAMK